MSSIGVPQRSVVTLGDMSDDLDDGDLDGDDDTILWVR
jgi:hypothetical protein